MNFSIGFIGGGNMATAIISGLMTKGNYNKEDIAVSVKSQSSVDRLSKQFDIFATRDNLSIVKHSKIVVLAIKPHLFKNIIDEIQSFVTSDHTIVSIAAGITLEQLLKAFPLAQIYRAMPNTPVAVGEGMTSLCMLEKPSQNMKKTVEEIFESVGKVSWIDESQIHAAIALHGSSPAYVFMMLEAMGDAGVRLGMSREVSYNMAAQALIGASKMFLESNLHPGALKDQVTSPKGTTIEAVAALEEGHYRSIIIEAMTRCAEKSIQMSAD